MTRRSFGALPEAEPGLEECQLSGWFYRLSPHVVLCTRRQSAATEALGQIIHVRGGDAFPPGHPTTRLSLDLLREALAAVSVHSLLDVGCGAGLLSLAAAALRVPRVVGADIAPAAVHITRENARDNGLAGALQVVRGSTECLKGPFELVIANLPWEVQMDKVSELNRLAGIKGPPYPLRVPRQPGRSFDPELPEAGMVSQAALKQGIPASRVATGYQLHLGCLVAGW